MHIGHVVLNGQMVRVLVRPQLRAGYVALKLRKSGPPGARLADEQAYLERHPAQLRALLAGQVVKL